MFDLKTLLIAIPALPLAACLLTAALGPRALRGRSHWPTIIALALAAAASLALVSEVSRCARFAADQVAAGQSQAVGFERVFSLWTWADVDGFKIEAALRADPLSAIMLAMVTFISLLVAIYSIGYMHDDPGAWRFFCYIPLFVFSMTMLVASSNFLMLYVFWEAVGLCSYLLIGFWYKKPSAAAAGKKAFLVNRIGDFGFALGVFLLFTAYGTLDFHDPQVVGPTHAVGILGQMRLGGHTPFVGGGIGAAICLLLLSGACGKSAQFPLHVWLPDAMEGPTPVSALIHAATMVTAGVYLLARCLPLFLVSEGAQVTVATIGGLTALMAGLMALGQTDLKRILAYSTISQLGYMFLALGTATLLGASAGMFHLVTHAFFKALLFLGAGSVMHAMGGVIDLKEFGGLRHRMPTTHWTFLFGCLALAGVAPFSGFFSKERIFAAVESRMSEGAFADWYGVLFWIALATVFLTALYTFRAFFLAFYGEERAPRHIGHHAHESPKVMTAPLVVLALGAIGIGAYFEYTQGFFDLLAQTPSLVYAAGHGPMVAEEPAGAHLRMALLSTLFALGGIAVAVAASLGSPQRRAAMVRPFEAMGIAALLRNKFFFDEIYEALVVWPCRQLADAAARFDMRAIDGLVDWVGCLPKRMASLLRPMQNGGVQLYALAMALGVLVLLGALFL